MVADNGPGFSNDTPEDLVTPFFTRRNGGMGLGLYIVSEVMRVNHGRLIFSDEGDVELQAQSPVLLLLSSSRKKNDRIVVFAIRLRY
ncbi:MAG: sensor histidine kinase [Uliginosibacterium sp.]|nr:sensor histidine kinase [Uliginosibacterium sp.]